MGTWTAWKARLQTLWKTKGSTVLIAAGLCGMVLLGISSMLPAGEPVHHTEKTGAAEQSAEDYSKAMEQKLETLLTQVQGVGVCTVLVTTQTGVENVYAVEQSQSSNETSRYEQEVLSQQTQQSNVAEKYILLDAGSGQKQALVKTKRMPTVQGVVVVCDGGGNPIVREQVLSVVATATGVAYHRVHVTERAKGALP